MPQALVGLGGNVGDARATLAAAVAAYCDGVAVRLLARSPDYRTAPWGDEDQPSFVNVALRVETELTPHELLARGLRVEAQFGRDRARERRWGPRTLDIDLLAYADIELDEPRLQLPHPRLAERAFVLAPLREVAPDWRIGGRSVAELAGAIDLSGATRL